MAKNKNQNSKLKKLATPPSSRKNINVSNVDAQFLGLATQPKFKLPENAYLALRYSQPDHECFSAWAPDELKAFSDFTRKLNQQPWRQIFESGGKIGAKTGLGYTKHADKSKLPQCPVVKTISEDIDFFELRVSQKARVDGPRSLSTFFLVWLDRNHQICPI